MTFDNNVATGTSTGSGCLAPDAGFASMIGYVSLAGRGRIDDCLSRTVRLLEGEGWRLAGTVRKAPADIGAHPCDMDLRVLPDGPLLRISQRLGSQARGCRLDGEAIENIAFEVEKRLDGADALIVNKFGKQEGTGRGLCAAIATALETGIPVLVGVNALNLPDFVNFVGEPAQPLEPDPETIRDWLASISKR